MIKESKGITLIALVISIIVMMIIAGISINVITGENGLIAQAQDAKLMTELSNVLLDVESDILNIKMSQMDYKLSANSVINLMNRYMKEKYETDVEKGGIGVYKYTLIPKNTNIPNLKLAVNGDVYVDNYKRGRINFSENELVGKVDAQITDYVGFRLIDGIAGESISNSDVIVVAPKEECPENSAVMWLNANSEVFAVGKMFAFLPLGLFDYEFSCLKIDDAEKLSQFDGKYLINETVQMKKVGNEYEMEIDIFHYKKHKYMEFLIKESEEDLYPTISKEVLFGGCKIASAGICISSSVDFKEGETSYLWANYSPESVVTLSYGDYDSQLDEYYVSAPESIFKNFAKAHGGIKRIYYCNYVTYYKYEGDILNSETGKIEPKYKEDEEPSGLRFGAIKYIDL